MNSRISFDNLIEIVRAGGKVKTGVDVFNANVVTQIFRTYAKKDNILQYILHTFVKSIGIYPPGSRNQTRFISLHSTRNLPEWWIAEEVSQRQKKSMTVFPPI